jgi:hypothetical protein
MQEFQQFVTPDDGRKFTEFYNIQHLQSTQIDTVSPGTISTTQRLYSMLRHCRVVSKQLGTALPQNFFLQIANRVLLFSTQSR